MSAQALDRRNISPQTLEKLRATVIQLFSQGLFHKVGIRDIAKQAEVGPQTIYKYFGNKDELIFACIKPDLEALTEELQRAVEDAGTQALDQFRAFLFAFVGYYLRNRRIAEIVYFTIPARQWVANPEFTQDGMMNLLEQVLELGQSQGSVRADASAKELVDLMAGAFSRYIMRKLTELQMQDADQECEHLLRLALPLVQQSPVKTGT
ncbi:TetR/AcrR family transcriptional regulator [Pseudomaricurvus alkylphenolicus]|jgi:AcrR family transcriptional regulator|uniref:TetR/AcrR family transcriptional regulator n=1 Tax=Pseudomaricurvus alkylphenolicus TaxID=1306991 RepID=UPI001424759F|nr:TetR/AcrR family transcriptional regulator [Pseudomaricurvus alkylphenolicus]NIB39279.1 TetR/AcrR family transcriptional regulator [Pseudomaricurvus alkylphenolicus]